MRNEIKENKNKVSGTKKPWKIYCHRPAIELSRPPCIESQRVLSERG